MISMNTKTNLVFLPHELLSSDSYQLVATFHVVVVLLHFMPLTVDLNLLFAFITCLTNSDLLPNEKRKDPCNSSYYVG